MSPENRALFHAHALQSMPREACALLLVEKGREKLILCPNRSADPDSFQIAPEDYASAEDRGEIIAVVHSHVFISAQPSEADRVSCEASGLEWFIHSVPTGAWFSFRPEGYQAPLVGRQFSHGVLDCYTLIRDYYSRQLNIEIPDFDREFEWWERGGNLYEENFEKAGFFEVKSGLKDLRPHDVLLFQIHSKVINHGAVYLGADVMLHHLNKRLSSREIFGGMYKKNCVKVVRHENSPSLR